MKLDHYIRANAISPSPTLKNKRQSESHFKKQWKSVLLKKKVELENISETVKFLIKNDNITGEIIRDALQDKAIQVSPTLELTTELAQYITPGSTQELTTSKLHATTRNYENNTTGNSHTGDQYCNTESPSQNI